jgi:hypothetical protein
MAQFLHLIQPPKMMSIIVLFAGIMMSSGISMVKSTKMEKIILGGCIKWRNWAIDRYGIKQVN